MRFSPTVLTSRFRAVADRLARGSAVPAGTDQAEREEAAKRPGSRERGAMRRRLRQQRKLRDALLTELGALVMEAHRHGRDDAGVIRSKAAEAAAVDAEAAALAETLGEGGDMGRLTATGLAVSCHACGTLVATRASFCERCGADLSARPEPEATSADAMAVEAASADGVAVGSPAEPAPGDDEVEPVTAAEPAPANGDGSEQTTVLEPVETAGNGDEPAQTAPEREAPR